MNEKSRNLEIYPELLDDLINLEYLIVFNNYGITLYSIDVGRVEILDLLISGLLQAIITMIKEISPQKFSKKEDRIEVKEISSGEQGLIVYYCQSIPSDENSIIVACFCSKTCSNHFKTRLKEVTANFSAIFRNEILNFAGNTNPFLDSVTFFESYLWIDLLYPQQLIDSHIDNLKDKDEEFINLYNIIKDFNRKLAQNEGIFVKEIIQIALRTLKLTYFDLLALIIKFFNESLLLPISIEYSEIEEEILKDAIEINKIPDVDLSDIIDSVNSPENINPIDKNPDSISEEQLRLVKRNSSFEKADIENEKNLANTDFEIEQNHKEDEIKTDWFQEFLDKLTDTPEVTLKNENLITSTLIREIEYEFHLKDSQLYYGNLNDLENINFKMSHYLIKERLNNVFSGPKFILISKRNKQTILSGILTRNEYFIVLGH